MSQPSPLLATQPGGTVVGVPPGPAAAPTSIPMSALPIDASQIQSGVISPARLPAPIAPTVVPASSRGPNVVVIADTPANRSSVGPAIRAALDSLPAGQPGRIVLPSGPWILREPIWWDRQSTELVGEGGATWIGVEHLGPAILVMARNPFGPEHRPDCFGQLDASAAPQPGRRWGLALAGSDGSSFLCVDSFPPAFGREDWRDTPGLTFSIKLKGPIRGDALAGLGGRDDPSPWVVVPDGGTFLCRFRTEEPIAGRADDPPREFRFGSTAGSSAAAAVDLTLQVRLDRAGPDGLNSIRAWQAGVEVPVTRGYGTRLATGTPAEPSFVPADNWHFRNNHLMSFKVGASNSVDHWMVAPAQRETFAVHGLWVGCGDEYDSDARGNQVRRDGGVLDDNYRYLGGGGRDPDKLIARLHVEEPPGTGDGARFVRMVAGSWAGGRSSLGLMIGDNLTTIGGPTFRNLDLQLPLRGGAGILLGPFIDATFDGVGAGGGAYGVKALYMGAVYDLYVRNGCRLEGNQAWLQAVDCIAEVDDLRRAPVTRSALRFASSDVRVGRVDTGGGGQPAYGVVECLAANDYAGSYEFGYINHDQEGPPAAVLVLAERHATGGTSLRVGSAYPGWRDATTPIVRLVDRVGPGGGPGVLDARNLFTAPGVTAPAVAASGNWRPAPPAAWQAAPQP